MKLLLMLALIFNVSAFAKEIKILDVYNNYDSETNEFLIDVDQDLVIEKFHKDTYSGSNLIERESFEVSKVLEGGLVLERRQGLEAIKLYAKEFSVQNGAKLEVQYLINGATGRRNSLHIKLEKDYTGNWMLFSEAQEEISQMNVIVNRQFGMLIGIREIIFN